MTIEQMHKAFETRFRTLNRDKEFTSSEIDYYLNLGQRELFEELLPYFDKDDRVKAIFFPLMAVEQFTVFSSPLYGKSDNSVTVTLPSDFKVAKGETATISDSSNSTYSPRVKSISQDYYNLNKDNPFKKPYSKLIWRIDYPSTTGSPKIHELILDEGYTISKYTLRYVKELTDMDVFNGIDASMHKMVHEDIVYRAYLNAAKDLGLLQQSNEKQNKQ